MSDIETKALFTMRMKVETQPLGPTHGAERRVVILTECIIDGDRVKGRVLPGGSDWLTIEPDGAVSLDCRMVIQTDDGQLIGVSYRGLRHGPPDAMIRLNQGEAIDTSGFYHRVAILFDTSAEKYKWLNRILAIGKGRKLPEGGVYEVFEVL
jgi:Protein of unknown function (DUF3237)